jgi:hypothetical protein
MTKDDRMTDVPVSILASVPDDARPAVQQWWASLAEPQRQQTAELWDGRREACFFEPQRDEAGHVDDWKQVPAVEGGRFVPHDDSVRLEEWLEDWQEYVLGHEEVVLLPHVVVVFRTFHICQGEPAAQAVVAARRLPADFQCPVNSRECPMHRVQALVPKRTLYLSPAAAGGWWVVAAWERNDVPQAREK